MTLILASRVLDLGLSVLDTECDAITVCSARPTSYADATTAGGHCLAIAALTRGTVFGVPQADLNGRKTVAVATKSANAIANGTATYWSAIDSTTQRVLASDIVASPFSVTVGQKVSLASFAVSLDNLGIVGTMAAAETGDTIQISSATSLSGILETIESADIVIIRQSNWWGDDGSANAPTGAAMYPTLLSSRYSSSNRPPWLVAGVDYRVGINTGVTLKDPAVGGNLPAGASYSGTQITVSGANVVLDGLDCSLHNGVNIYSTGSNLIIRNCKFGGSNYASIPGTGIIDHRAASLSVTYCELTGSGNGGESTFIHSTAGGAQVLQYNWFKNFPQHVYENVLLTNTAWSMDYRFNYIEKGAMANGAHLNWLQLNSGTLNPLRIEFNTCFQDNEISSGEGFQFYGNGPILGYPECYVGNCSCSYNVMMAVTGGPGNTFGVAMSVLLHNANVALQGTVNVVNYNYIDISSAYGFGNGSFNSSRNWTQVTGNKSMVNGATVTP